MEIKIPKIMVTATSSGAGKTTVTCGLLSALKKQGANVVAFKSGPDYIDPMFHSKVINTPSYNLDLFLCQENTVAELFCQNASSAEIAVIEGAMGIYDGKGFKDDSYSANHLARVLKCPQILVVNVKGKAFSLLAEIWGYLHFKENLICGVILNNCSEKLYNSYKNEIEANLKIEVLGFLPKIEQAEIKSRHLGLVTAEEIENLKEKIDILGETALKTIDISRIMAIAKEATPLNITPTPIEPIVNGIKIAVAKDSAFCFYYQDNIKLLQLLGAEICYFSPLNDEQLPNNIAGLYLGGGYPEVNIEKLSQNTTMLNSIKTAIENGLPTFAECGGFIYLGKSYLDNGIEYPLCNVINSTFFMTNSLVRFGYSKLISNNDNLLLKKGETINCHEFHYTDGTFVGDNLTSQKSEKLKYNCAVAKDNLFAAYPHIHFYGNINTAISFVKKAEQFLKTTRE